jgi:hypothetical protein
VPYWELVTRSFRIAWDHKYLWLIAFFSGEGGGGSSYNYSQRSTTTTTPAEQPDFAAALQQAVNWIGAHAGLIVALAIVWLVVVIAFFILAAVCEGATVRGSAEHDAGRAFGLRLAWRMGVHSMWPIVRLRLLILLINLPLLLLIGAWVFALLKAIADRNSGAAGPLVLTGLLLFVVWIVYASYVFLLERYGNRVIVLEEQRAATAALARAHRLLIKRLGRSVLVLLLAIGVALVIGIAFLCLVTVLFVPFLMIGAALSATSGSSGLPLAVILLAAVILIPLSLLVGGFFSAQGSTYWTLAFRRLDLDYSPAYAYPVAPQIPPAPQA